MLVRRKKMAGNKLPEWAKREGQVQLALFDGVYKSVSIQHSFTKKATPDKWEVRKIGLNIKQYKNLKKLMGLLEAEHPELLKEVE